MRMSMIMCKQTQSSLYIPNGGRGGGLNLQLLHCPPLEKEKVVVVMGPTGTGKSRLSIDLATRFHAEIINSDKIQVYEGLDITTNKITEEEQRGIPHHLLGTINPNSDFTSMDFGNLATLNINTIHERGHLPIVAGGSNSFIEALVNKNTPEFRSNYEYCFLWVDVSFPILNSFVSERVDQMVEMGMVDEVREFFRPDCDYTRGIRKAIGVPEFDKYFKMEPYLDKADRIKLLKKVINEIKKNTETLACKQLKKIYRLRNVKGWKVHRLDATEVFMKNGRESTEVWDRAVVEPSSMIVSRFLRNVGREVYGGEMMVRGVGVPVPA